MSTITKSLATNFSGNLKSAQFHKEILANVSIVSANLIGINKTADVIEILFDGVLSASDQTTLNGIIDLHSPDNSIPRNEHFTVTPKLKNEEDEYEVSKVFVYRGSTNIGAINYIDLVSYMDSSITSYSARVVDRNTGLVIAEKTGMTNTEEQVQDLGTISNVPTDKTLLELQIKRTGGNKKKYVYAYQLVVYYGN